MSKGPIPWYTGPDCVFCAGSGVHCIEGIYKFCSCEDGKALSQGDPEAAARAQEKLDRQEGLVR